MIEKNKLGMSLFLLSEANFFLMLILAYAYYHAVSVTGPTAETALHPLKTAIYTMFLLASSFSIWRAEKNFKNRRHSRLCAWLLITIVLGSVFLFGQGNEYVELIRNHITISRDLFGTTFFTLTGFHGLHVMVGLLALTILLGLALAGDFVHPRPVGVEVVALYWHFVDVVWIVIFSVVYLRGLL
jgi:heme/copper-type cytochrome/quinol oxidase subunit 3